MALIPILVGIGVVLGMGVQVAGLARSAPERTAFQKGPASIAKRWLPLEAMDADLVFAVVASEDARFLEHGGFDPTEIGEAVKDAAWEGKAPRGASTLTQQLAKNVFLSPERTLRRKLAEAIYAGWMELILGKRRILELYLNEAEMGRSVYGVEAAAQRHFGRSATDLTERQAAELAATLPAPRRANPSRRTPGFERRVQRVLQRMELYPGLKAELQALTRP